MVYEVIDHAQSHVPVSSAGAEPRGGGRVEMFAVRDDDYLGDWFYRLQYYHPDEGEILRYDNAHDDADLGWHHRHVAGGEDTEIAFLTLGAHIVRFLNDVAALIEEAPEIDTATDTDTHDHH